MNNLIKEKRKLFLDNKIFEAKPIRKLAEVFNKVAKELLENNNEDLYIIYSIDAEDNSSYESDSIVILAKMDC